MRINLTLIATCALLLVQGACAGLPGQPPARHATAGAAGVVCPSTDFAAFLGAFADSADVQKAFTADPLEKRVLDVDAEPEPKAVVRRLARGEVAFPLIPPRLERERQSLTLRVAGAAPDSATAVLAKPDTDYLVSYFFVKHDCWQLARVEDPSL